MDGIEVCRRLKSNLKLAQIPIIMVTAKGEDRDVVAGLAVGANDYITKPFNIQILTARLEAVLRVKKARDAAQRANARLEATNELLAARNKQLSELNQTAYEFVNTVSHDFRTPLSVIKEFASIIADGLDGPVTDEQREHLGIIANCVDDLASMVGDMLDISKLEAGRLTVRRTRCAVDDIFQRVRPVLERRAAANQVQLEIALDETLPALYCDAAEIGRVIVNLAINAIKFAGGGGHVQIWARADEEADRLVIGVTDDGPGIAPDNLRLIFERFRQVGVNARASTKGVGLGLSIAKELVALNFGQMSVQTEQGKGSTFSFTVPTAAPLSVLELYLEQPDSSREAPRYVSLAIARVPDECQVNLAAEVDELLHDVLRSTDLVLWTSATCWLIVIGAGQNDSIRILERIERSWEEANRNRPGEKLPAVTLNSRGTWAIPARREEFVSHFQTELETMEGAYV